MSRHPLHWRARWALAQVTGVLFSSLVWILLLASVPSWLLGGLVAGTVLVLAFRTRPMLLLAFGARPAALADREVVLRAIVPVASLRGRNQPRVFVGKGRRAAGWDVTAADRRTLLVSEAMLTAITAGTVSELEVSARVARAFGQLPARRSRIVLAVGLYCLPWTVVHAFVDRISFALARVPLMSFAWRMRMVVFFLGLLDAVQHGRWEAAIPLTVLSVLTYTTGPLDRAWRCRLAELGDRRVEDEGLGSVPAAGRQDGSRSVQRLETFG